MAWVSVAIIGGAVIGAVGSQAAANTQANAQDQATMTQQQMYDQQWNAEQPYRQAGQTALQDIAYGTGNQNWNPYISGPDATGSAGAGFFTHQFNGADLKSNLAPNYDFQLQQGLGATANAANADGGMMSGNALKAINDYAQNYAGNAYQQAFNNYTTNQTNIYNRLASLAGLGQAASTNASTGASNFAANISNTIAGAGASRAAGQVGTTNAIGNGVNNLGSWYAYQNMSNPGTAGAASTGSTIPNYQLTSPYTSGVSQVGNSNTDPYVSSAQ